MVRVKFAEQFGLSFWPPTGPITAFLKLYLTATGLSSPPALCSSGRNELGFLGEVPGFSSAITTK